MPKPKLPELTRISSSFQGTLHIFFKRLFWIIVSAIVGMICWASFSTTLHLLAIEVGHEIGWGEATHLLYAQDGIQEIWFILKGAGWLISAFVFLTNLRGLIDCFYFAKRVNVIDFNKKSITETLYSFPLGYTEDEITFNSFVRITVFQNSLQRIFGTGNIRITFTRKENFESVRDHWWISFVSNPIPKMKLLTQALGLDTEESLTISKSSGKQ